ncbi:hypothetical protein B4083_4337 [Bacillus cereus]|nr:hypothetical protein B4083_4337 [Bacillus cereus]
MREVLRHEELAAGTGYQLKAQAARSESRSLQALDQEALFASTERAKWPEILAVGTGYQLKAQAARSESQDTSSSQYKYDSHLKKQIFPYITLSNIPLKT